MGIDGGNIRLGGCRTLKMDKNIKYYFFMEVSVVTVCIVYFFLMSRSLCFLQLLYRNVEDFHHEVISVICVQPDLLNYKYLKTLRPYIFKRGTFENSNFYNKHNQKLYRYCHENTLLFI